LKFSLFYEKWAGGHSPRSRIFDGTFPSEPSEIVLSFFSPSVPSTPCPTSASSHSTRRTSKNPSPPRLSRCSPPPLFLLRYPCIMYLKLPLVSVCSPPRRSSQSRLPIRRLFLLLIFPALIAYEQHFLVTLSPPPPNRCRIYRPRLPPLLPFAFGEVLSCVGRPKFRTPRIFSIRLFGFWKSVPFFYRDVQRCTALSVRSFGGPVLSKSSCMTFSQPSFEVLCRFPPFPFRLTIFFGSRCKSMALFRSNFGFLNGGNLIPSIFIVQF